MFNFFVKNIIIHKLMVNRKNKVTKGCHMKSISINACFLFFIAIVWPFTVYAENAPEIFIQTGHSGDVNSVCFSPDGKYLVSGSSDNTVKLWEVSSGQMIRTFQGHSSSVLSVSFSPDGRRIASGSYDKTVKLWDATTAKLISTFQGHTSWVMSVSFSPDGQHIVSGSNDTSIRIWNVQTELASKIIYSLPKKQWLTITPGKRDYISSSNGDAYAGIRYANDSYHWKPLSDFREQYKMDIRILSPENNLRTVQSTIGVNVYTTVPLQQTQVFVNNQAIETETLLILDPVKKDHRCDYFIPLLQNKNTIRFDVTNADGIQASDEVVVFLEED